MTKPKIQLLLFLFFLSIYILTGQGSIQSVDGKIMFFLTQAMVENQSVSFSEVVSIESASGPQFSKYGLGMSVLAIPFYIFGKVLSLLLGIEASLATQCPTEVIKPYQKYKKEWPERSCLIHIWKIAAPMRPLWKPPQKSSRFGFRPLPGSRKT